MFIPKLDDHRLESQLSFLLEIDKLKQVFRQNFIADQTRRENSGEHSWHMAVYAVTLREYAPEGLDMSRVVRMCLVHDLVEIYAGDTFCYDRAANLGKLERELESADKLFALLPPDQAPEIRALWDEFEAEETPEARFAAVMDRFQCLMLNANTQGGGWRIHDIHRGQVLRRMDKVRRWCPALWPTVLAILDQVQAAGYLRGEE